MPEVKFALNNTINKSTGEAPSTLLFRCKQHGNIVDKLVDYIHNLKDLSDNFAFIRATASTRIEKIQRENELRVNKTRKPAHVYQTGDLVLIRNFDSTPGVFKKLILQFKGLYKVTKYMRNNRYVIVKGCQNTCKPYIGVWGAHNMRPWIDVQKI